MRPEREGASGNVRIAYCSACDRPVRVRVREGAPEWTPPADAVPSDIVCLEYGETCTGSMCPLFDVPTERMKNSYEAHRRATEEGGS